jgi:hypothetical protein
MIGTSDSGHEIQCCWRKQDGAPGPAAGNLKLDQNLPDFRTVVSMANTFYKNLEYSGRLEISSTGRPIG